jgi:hypothetical protein
MLIASLFTIAKLWNQPRCPLTVECINSNGVSICSGYYSAKRRNEIMSFAGTWMKLEMIMLHEISQTEKDKYYMFSLICMHKRKN